jgi:hypothetical protein
MWQRFTVHFYRNVWTAAGRASEVAATLKAIHAQERRIRLKVEFRSVQL